MLTILALFSFTPKSSKVHVSSTAIYLMSKHILSLQKLSSIRISPNATLLALRRDSLKEKHCVFWEQTQSKKVLKLHSSGIFNLVYSTDVFLENASKLLCLTLIEALQTKPKTSNIVLPLLTTNTPATPSLKKIRTKHCTSFQTTLSPLKNALTLLSEGQITQRLSSRSQNPFLTAKAGGMWGEEGDTITIT